MISTPGDFSALALPVGPTFYIPGPSTTVKDLEDMAYRSERGRAFKPTVPTFVITPDGRTHLIRGNGNTEIAEIQEFAQALVEAHASTKP